MSIDTFNTIKLKVTGHLDEAIASVAVNPGHLLMTDSNGKVKPHNVPGGKAEKMFAVEDGLIGAIITDQYAIGKRVTYVFANPGDKIYAKVPASAVAIVIGDWLVSNGDGTLIKRGSLGDSTLYVSVAASAAVTNTTTATAFDKSYTIVASTLVAGDVIRIRGQGIATATNSTDTLAIAIKIGSTTIATIPATDVADNDIFTFDVTLVLRTVGASGTFVASIAYNIGVAGTGTTRAHFKASTAIDTTAAQAITIVATWSVANAGNSCRLDVLSVERIHILPEETIAVAQKAVDNSAGVTEAFIPARIL